MNLPQRTSALWTSQLRDRTHVSIVLHCGGVESSQPSFQIHISRHATFPFLVWNGDTRQFDDFRCERRYRKTVINRSVATGAQRHTWKYGGTGVLHKGYSS